MLSAARRAVEIRVEGLRKSFQGLRVLSGVDLEILQGDLVAIVGGSGCGKTVLLQHILGNLRPDTGRILVADHDSTGAPLRDIARLDEEEMDGLKKHWAVVFQKNALFSGSVYDNIALWLREIKRMKDAAILPIARRALESVGLSSGDELLHKHRDELSGGMAKRVALARALAMDPIVMFFDEPTTGLDPATASQIHELIGATHRRREGTTTLIITHDKELLRRLEPRVVMLHEGRVYFDGTYGEFARSESPVIRPYFVVMPVLHGRVPA